MTIWQSAQIMACTCQ